MSFDVKILENEYWWGGGVNAGHLMPFDKNTTIRFSLTSHAGGGPDQYSSLLLSSKGRYIYSEKPFTVNINSGVISFEGEDFTLNDENDTLRGAYLSAINKYFPFSKKMPDELFFGAVQYNTWIELGTEQTSKGILKYAKNILKNGLEPGILMIDGGWQEDYGFFDFNRRKIPNPKMLIDKLHDLGFKVMLWVSPIVSSAGTQFKMLRDKGYLCVDENKNVAVRQWWSGYSAVLDLTNPDARDWFNSQLDFLVHTYGVDGFKFDAGDAYFYKDTDLTYEKGSAREHTSFFNEVGVKYSFNEFRAAYNFGGREIVSRLHDKGHSWDSNGLNTLIPHTIVQGLLGYVYCCPDMVGGGAISGDNGLGEIDEELFIRWTQANALLSMMQMSISPWRVLSKKSWEIVKKYILLHSQFGETFKKLAKQALKTSEPIVRSLCYQYPDGNFETVNDEFLLGDDILVAPVIQKGQTSRVVKFPEGKWQDEDGNIYEGGEYVVSAPLDKLPWFKRV